MAPNEQELREKGEKALAELREDEVSAEAEKQVLEELDEKAEKLSDREDQTPEEAEELSRDEKKQRLAQVLERGILNDMLANVKAPAGRRGKFVRDNESDIMRYENLGFRIETFAEGDTPHGTGDNRKVIGDVVFMTISEEDYQILQEVREEKTRQKLGAAKREYVSKSQQRNPDVPVFDRGNTEISKGG